MTGIRDLFVGRLALPTVDAPVAELLGSEVTTTGDSTAVGQRRVKGFTLIFPIHGGTGDANPYVVGQRMRRQLRSLMQNAQYRLSGLYVSFAFDPERDGWMVIGTASLADAEGGPTLAEYTLTIDNAYRTAGITTHRDGYRIDLTDLRLATSPVDYYGAFVGLGAGFSTLTPLALLALPVGATDPAVLDAVAVVATRPSVDGNVPIVTTKEPSWTGLTAGPLTNGDVVTWERTEANFNKGDVVLYDRRGFLGPFGTGGAYDIAPYPADVQTSYGWEEMYGEDYPYSWLAVGGTMDAPVIHNGICRVRYDSSNTPGWKVDVWNGAAYVEQGKILTQGASSNFDNTLLSAAVVEYTPDRAVIQAVVQTSSAPVLSRERVLITLQRGWTGPRVEVYAPAAYASITYATPTPADANDSLMKVDTAGAGAYLSSALGTGTSPFAGAGTVLGASTFTGENEVVLLRQGGQFQVNFAVLGPAVTANAVSVSAYASATNAVSFTTSSGDSSPQGWIGVRLGFFPSTVQQVWEAESIRFVSGNTSQIADAAASAGQTVQSTATATAEVLTTATTLKQGVYRAFARVKASAAGGTASFTWQLGAVVSGISTTTSTSYVWLDLGEVSATAANATFQLNAWRSAGTGNAIVDRVELVLMQDRTSSSAAYVGARDHAQACLYDQLVQTRKVPRA